MYQAPAEYEAYGPDYGLDFSIEAFKTLEPADGKRPTHETLGEQFFMQRKSIDDSDVKPLDIFNRGNPAHARSVPYGCLAKTQ